MEALDYGPGCPQSCHDEPHVCPPTTSEDCLRLSVFAPSDGIASNGSAPKLRPIMFWITGGNYDVMAGNVELYDGTKLASEGDVIVVLLNYRIGALGFACWDGSPCNLGLLDQRLALEWVRDNAAAFGGDPAQVTIFGQSAGGGSVAAHLVSPPSWPLFSRVISQSNPASIGYKNRTGAQTQGDMLAGLLGCNSTADPVARMKCMRSRPAEEVVAVQFHASLPLQIPGVVEKAYTYSPVTDTPDIADQPLLMIQAGRFAKDKPVMLGDTRNDARQFVFEPIPTPVSPLAYEAIRVLMFGNWSEGVNEYYPLPSDVTDARDLMSVIGTDYVFRCSNRAIARSLACQGTTGEVFLYTFDHPLSFNCWGKNYSFCWMNSTQVCHGERRGSIDPYAGECCISLHCIALLCYTSPSPA